MLASQGARTQIELWRPRCMCPERPADRIPSIFPGATIATRFRLERVLGRGSMGSVWLARHLALNVDVAVKFIDAALRDQRDHRNRFTLEAQAAARINSPHVVNVLDFGTETSGRMYIAMEYLQGEDLAKLLERAGGKVSVDATARIVSHACRGLNRAHALGVAHRDIKPENLFLCGAPDDEDFVLKILDFGVAKASDKADTDFVSTAAGQLVGSPAYMSPEQARGSLEIDFRSDLFSLAVVVYHCLTGNFAFGGASLTDLLINIVSKEPLPPSHHVPELPVALDEWFLRALDKSPLRRFQSAKDFAQSFMLALGVHGSSTSDYSSSGTILSRTVVDWPAASELSSSLPPVSLPAARRSSRPDLTSASNTTPLVSVGLALMQVAEVEHVLGVALITPEGGECAHQSRMGLPASSFSELTPRLRVALAAFENLNAVPRQALALYFETAVVLVRWVDTFMLLVVATEQVHPTILSVSVNAAFTALLALAEQAGGAEIAFRPPRLAAAAVEGLR